MKKEYRIKKNEEIEAILKNKNIAAGKNFVLYKKENHDNIHFRYAVSVPKKFGDAVYRNQIKRRIRMIIREKKLKNNFDFFVIIKTSAAKLSFDEIEKELNYVLKKSLLEDNNEETN